MTPNSPFLDTAPSLAASYGVAFCEKGSFVWMHFAGDATSVSAAAQEQSMSRVFCHGIIFSTAVEGFLTVSITNLYTSVWWPSAIQVLL